MGRQISERVLYRGLRSSIPRDALEVVTIRNPRGRKIRAEYFKDSRWVGWRTFHLNGLPESEGATRDGRKHGWEFRWDAPGELLNAEPFEHGLPHGAARQWDSRGRMVGKYTMIHGTGVDLWWQDYDSELFVAESDPMRDGARHGYERWFRQTDSVHIERHWWYGRLHGVEREWRDRERLARGCPRFFIADRRVTRATYLTEARTDPTLPPYRLSEDSPVRPGAIAAATELERRMAAEWRRLGRAKTRPLAPLVGGILIGGASSRMGAPKHMLPIGGTPLVERLHRAIAPFCEQVVILGRGAVPRALRSVKRIADTRGMRGPLAGLTAAFRSRPDRAWLIVACDMPNVDTDALDWLVGQRRPGRSAVIPRVEGGSAEPLLAIYEPNAREYLEWLGRRNRGPADMADCATAHAPIVGGWIARAWKNVNTPDELAACSR